MKQILKFSSDWCQPCKRLQQLMEKEIIPNLPDDFEFKVINTDEEIELTETFNIKSLPTLIFINDENLEFGRINGLCGKEKIVEMITKMQ